MIIATPRSSPPAPLSRRVRSVQLRGPAGILEGVVNEGSANAVCTSLLCHPHPLGGGSLHNKVVYHAMKVMNAPEWGFEWPVLRFNFRGTGRSEGKHDGAAETGDVLSALDWIENEYKLPVVVAGFSFGAAMALKACCGSGCFPSLQIETGGTRQHEQGKIRALVAIGLPMRSGAARTDPPPYDYSFLANCSIPKLFLSGDNDQFATKAEVIEVVSAAAEPKHLALVPGADHFFNGRLERMQSSLSRWLKEYGYDPGQRSAV